jgi:hypothetical protein
MAGGSMPASRHVEGRLRQRGLQHTLLGGRRLGDDGNRFAGEAPTGHQPLGDAFDMLQGHVEHDHRRALGKGRPIDRIGNFAGRIMAGDEGHRRVAVAMGDRNAGVSQAADPRRDARHDAEGNAVIDQGQGFLAATAKDERIAALQPQHTLPFPRQLHQTQRDVGLLGRGLATALAGIFEDGAGTGEVENGFVDQRVIDDDIRRAQRLDGEQSEEAGIARAGAGQPDPARFQIRQCRE